MLIIPAIIVGCNADAKSCAAMLAAFDNSSNTVLKGKGLRGDAVKVRRWRETNPGTWSWVDVVCITITNAGGEVAVAHA